MWFAAASKRRREHGILFVSHNLQQKQSPKHIMWLIHVCFIKYKLDAFAFMFNIKIVYKSLGLMGKWYTVRGSQSQTLKTGGLTGC